jgi:hypothetical protein
MEKIRKYADEHGDKRRNKNIILFILNTLPFFLKMNYDKTMDVAIEYNPSAFKHNVTESAIRYAIMNVIYDDIWDEIEDKHLLLGFDNNGNLLEIMYNVIDENTINVFHAMNCQSIYYHLLD